MREKLPAHTGGLNLKETGLAALIILIVTGIYFHNVILHPAKVISSPNSDYIGFLLSRTTFVVDHILQSGQLPLWRPSELCGIPALGNPQIGVFYPPNLLTLLLGPLFSLGLRFVACLLFAGLFTYVYCREIGMVFFASLFAALAFMLSGFIAANIYAGHIQHISTLVWLPLCLFFVERLARRCRLTDAVGLGVCLTLQFMAGHPEYFLYSSLAVGLYFLCVWVPGRRAALLLLLAFASVLFISLAAIQLFPTLEFISHMTRGKEGYVFASAGSLPYVSLLTFVLPNIFGSLAGGAYWGPGFYWENCGYMGAITIVLAVAGAFFARRPRAKIFLS